MTRQAPALRRPPALRVLLRQRHWKYATFCTEYDKAAKSVDPELTGTWPSRAQFHRWINGEVRGIPYPDACRVLEALFPGWTAEELFAPSSDELLARAAAQVADHEPEAGDPPRLDVDQLIADRFSDVSAVYATRSEFVSAMPPHTLFDSASKVRACGLSLNLLCQQYAEQSLRRLAEGGTEIQCLFLDPDGTAIQDREREEQYPDRHLSELTRVNILAMQRIRDHLTPDTRPRFQIAIYDETIRFNITLIDDLVGIIQPYLPRQRGVDSPTFVVRRRWPELGLFPMFEAVFSALWADGKPL